MFARSRVQSSVLGLSDRQRPVPCLLGLGSSMAMGVLVGARATRRLVSPREVQSLRQMDVFNPLSRGESRVVDVRMGSCPTTEFFRAHGRSREVPR